MIRIIPKIYSWFRFLSSRLVREYHWDPFTGFCSQTLTHAQTTNYDSMNRLQSILLKLRFVFAHSSINIVLSTSCQLGCVDKCRQVLLVLGVPSSVVQQHNITIHGFACLRCSFSAILPATRLPVQPWLGGQKVVIFLWMSVAYNRQFWSNDTRTNLVSKSD